MVVEYDTTMYGKRRRIKNQRWLVLLQRPVRAEPDERGRELKLGTKKGEEKDGGVRENISEKQTDFLPPFSPIDRIQKK